MANRILAARVANAIEARSIPNFGFHMARFADLYFSYELGERDRGCMTAGCIAAWTVLVSGEIESPKKLLDVNEEHWNADSDKKSIYRRAQRLLDLTDEEAHTLFSANPHATDGQVVLALRFIARTGAVVVPGSIVTAQLAAA